MAHTEGSRPCKRTPVQCPKCSSYSASVVNIDPPYARCCCADCDTIYNYRMREVTTDDDDNGSADEDDEDENFRPTKSKANADHPAHVKPAPAPEVGFLTSTVEKAIAAGPAGIHQAQRTALRQAKKYYEDAVDYWRKETDYLKQWSDTGDRFLRARERYARVWRPRFLAALSMINSVRLAARHTRVSRKMVYDHRNKDPEFAKQWDEAIEEALDLLHARVWQRCVEGDVEPVYHMGVVVGYIRKFSDKLQIEMLRAYRPDRFKTAGVQVNIGGRNNILVLSEDQRHRLMDYNREWLLSTPIEGEKSQDGTVESQPLSE